MKKVLLLLSLGILLIACKKTTQKNENVQSFVASESTCSVFDTLRSMTLTQQVAWLRDPNNHATDTIYDSCRVSKHEISQSVYEKAIADYWGTETPQYTAYELQEVEALSSTNDYSQFVAATLKTSNDIALEATNSFTETPNCFSLPLFYSLQRLYKLEPKSAVKFTIGKIDNADKIIFTVSNVSKFYDVSTCPL